MSFMKLQTEDRRLCMLLALSQTAGHGANHYLLQVYLESVGHTVSHDQVKTDLSWLAEQGLLGLQNHNDTLIAKLTTRGLDTAAGRTSVPGVKRPLPE